MTTVNKPALGKFCWENLITFKKRIWQLCPKVGVRDPFEASIWSRTLG